MQSQLPEAFVLYPVSQKREELWQGGGGWQKMQHKKNQIKKKSALTLENHTIHSYAYSCNGVSFLYIKRLYIRFCLIRLNFFFHLTISFLIAYPSVLSSAKNHSNITRISRYDKIGHNHNKSKLLYWCFQSNNKNIDDEF